MSNETGPRLRCGPVSFIRVGLPFRKNRMGHALHVRRELARIIVEAKIASLGPHTIRRGPKQHFKVNGTSSCRLMRAQKALLKAPTCLASKPDAELTIIQNPCQCLLQCFHRAAGHQEATLAIYNRFARATGV